MQARFARRTAKEPRWPPTAAPQGADFNVGAVIAIVLLFEFLTYAVRWRVIGVSTTVADFRGFLAINAAIVIAGVILVLVMGWATGAGLRKGRLSAWGIIPLVYVALATLVSAVLGGRLATTLDVFPWLVATVVLSAFQEEIAFRGILLYNLTRRFGGTPAVLVSSVLFAFYHLPGLFRQALATGLIVAQLESHFTFGVFMCRIRAETGALWFAVGVHALWNMLFFIDWTPAADPPAMVVAIMTLFRIFFIVTALDVLTLVRLSPYPALDGSQDDIRAYVNRRRGHRI